MVVALFIAVTATMIVPSFIGKAIAQGTISELTLVTQDTSGSEEDSEESNTAPQTTSGTPSGTITEMTVTPGMAKTIRENG